MCYLHIKLCFENVLYVKRINNLCYTNVFTVDRQNYIVHFSTEHLYYIAAVFYQYILQTVKLNLIWGQVFFWPEARLLGHDRDMLWNDVQIFETELDYHKFRQAAVKFYEIWKETAVDLRIKYS